MIPYFLKKNLGGGHKFSEFACFLFFFEGRGGGGSGWGVRVDVNEELKFL